jgi:hypothetical protein
MFSSVTDLHILKVKGGEFEGMEDKKMIVVYVIFVMCLLCMGGSIVNGIMGGDDRNENFDENGYYG